MRSVKNGAIAGPDPWKANTLEWFTPSPPPENNFDAIPRVRSVEPMKDIRRQVEQETGVEQRYQAGRPRHHDLRWRPLASPGSKRGRSPAPARWSATTSS